VSIKIVPAEVINFLKKINQKIKKKHFTMIPKPILTNAHKILNLPAIHWSYTRLTQSVRAGEISRWPQGTKKVSQRKALTMSFQFDNKDYRW